MVDLKLVQEELKRNPFKDQNGKLTIIQAPNWQLWGAIIARFAQFPLDDGKLLYVAKASYSLLLLVWAYEELVHGDSLFRRVLGLFVVIGVSMNVYSLYAQ